MNQSTASGTGIGSEPSTPKPIGVTMDDDDDDYHNGIQHDSHNE